MLISHRRQFIYLKTRKTASTSVEIYFEPFCVNALGSTAQQHFREAEVSEWGIVASRGHDDATWFNHISAARIRTQLGERLWNDYFKFCIIRNPFDQMVSWFWYSLVPSVRIILHKVEFSYVRTTFELWTRSQCFPPDRLIYCIEEKPAVDYFLRFEDLDTGMSEVCRRLAIPWHPERLGRFKGEYRLRKEHFSEYYDRTTADRIAKQFSWELQYFGYSL